MAVEGRRGRFIESKNFRSSTTVDINSSCCAHVLEDMCKGHRDVHSNMAFAATSYHISLIISAMVPNLILTFSFFRNNQEANLKIY